MMQNTVNIHMPTFGFLWGRTFDKGLTWMKKRTSQMCNFANFGGPVNLTHTDLSLHGCKLTICLLLIFLLSGRGGEIICFCVYFIFCISHQKVTNCNDHKSGEDMEPSNTTIDKKGLCAKIKQTVCHT